MFFLKSKVRVRFAPSPTGFLHVGGLRTALYNYLFAKKNHGTFVLRIEDTDRTRTVPGGVENIISTLERVSLPPDEGPYIQSQRLEIYKKYANELLGKEKAYKCYCSAERLDKLRQEQETKKLPTKYDRKCLGTGKQGGSFVIRQKMPDSGATKFNDLIHGEIVTENSVLDDHILLKADGFPTYNFANVIDDHLMKITHVIRGEEFISSTPKHVLLYQSFGWKLPQFAHLPLLLNPDRSKLSKRQGDVAVEEYLDKGYLPEALLNFVALLGWNPSSDREIFSLKELIKTFNLEKVNKSGAVFDIQKLEWLNGEYIRALSAKELLERAKPFLGKEGIPLENKKLLGAVKLEQERIKKLSDLPEAIKLFFELPKYEAKLLSWKGMGGNEVRERLSKLAEFLGTRKGEWSKEALEKEIKNWIKEKGWGNGEVLWPMRVALTGKEKSPPPFEVEEILGKEETLNRLKAAIKKL